MHGGGSGIGTSAMALAKEANVRCLVTAGRFVTHWPCAGLPRRSSFAHTKAIKDMRHELLVKSEVRSRSCRNNMRP